MQALSHQWLSERSTTVNPYFLIFEMMVYILFAGTLWHAFHKGYFYALELLWAAVYGFLLEWLTIQQLHAYHYGHFMIMMDGAPLCIALAWAVVIYSSMSFSSMIQLPEAARPILDALLALNIDLVLDVVAVRLGMWFWTGISTDQQWFGVPWANFWAWFIIVWSFSGFIRALRAWQGYIIRRWLYAPLAMFLSLCVLATFGEIYRLILGLMDANTLTPLFLIVGSVVIIVGLHPHIIASIKPEPMIIIIPLVFHLFAAITGIVYGIFARQPILGFISAAMLAIGIFTHLITWSRILALKSAPDQA